MITKTLLAAATSLLLVGPPRIAVQTTDLTGNALAMVTADYHTDEDDARIYGTLYSINQGQRAERAITLEKIADHRYRVVRSWTGTDPVVVVVGVEQGEGGKHGAAEALIRVGRGGRVTGVDTPTEREGNHTLQRRITQREINAALDQLGARAAD